MKLLTYKIKTFVDEFLSYVFDFNPATYNILIKFYESSNIIMLQFILTFYCNKLNSHMLKYDP